MTSGEALPRFIRSSFRSVWSLELLLLLKQQDRAWSRQELIEALRASDLVVAQGLDFLVAAGLAAIEPEGARYVPVSDAIARQVDATEQLYRARPDRVRRMIIEASSSGITAFADAFRLRKD